MSEGDTYAEQSESGIVRDIRLMALAVFIGVAAAFVGGLLIGWASSARPSTLSQAIEQANAGVLPSGISSTVSQAPPTASTLLSAPPASLYNLAFFGIISSLSNSQLGVETKAGPVGIELTGGTRFATVDLARSNRSRLSNGKLVLIVPDSSTQGSVESIAGTVVLLPN